MRKILSGRLGRVAVVAAPVAGLVLGAAANASAAITLEGSKIETPLSEVGSQVGPILVAVIVSFIGAMAIVALMRTGWKLGKKLIHALT